MLLTEKGIIIHKGYVSSINSITHIHTANLLIAKNMIKWMKPFYKKNLKADLFFKFN